MTRNDQAISAAREMVEAIETVLLGQRRAIELATCAFLAGGHLLIEDVPGVGKTTLARALARVCGADFSRIQFTSDLLPADITGISVWDSGAGEFKFKKGPLFGNIVLADEINRSTPKTQSALLEAMSEGSVTVDGTRWPLPSPFMVIATQNKQEHHGTYPLPESQLDRFLLCISMGYPEPNAERSVVSRRSLEDPVDRLRPILTQELVPVIAEAVDQVHMDAAVLDYIMDLTARTRKTDLLELGVGPRGGMALHRAARAHAILKGRDFCLPDDVKDLVLPALAHRVVANGNDWNSGGSRQNAVGALNQILAEVEIPV